MFLSVVMAVTVFFWSTAEALLLNFRDVDIRQIIETVGELTGRNFLIDPRVKAKVTILANEDVPEDALYDVLLSILAMHGFRAVDGLGMTRIVPINRGARLAPTEITEDLITEIVPVRNLAAPTIVPMIKPLMTQQAQLAVHKETNLMIITESRANIERVKTIIGKIDKKSLLEHEVIQLRHMLASDAVKIVSRATRKSVRGLVEIISEDENNRIIMTGSPDVRLSVRALLAELDTPVKLSRVEGELLVVPLRHAKAEEIQDILSSLLNSRFLENAAPIVDTKKPAAKPKAKPKPGDKKITAKKKSDRNKERKYVVQADPATNAIIIGGTPEILEILQGIIRRLDVPRPQVLIEAIIADVSDNKAEALGTQIGLGARDVDDINAGGLRTTSDYSGLLGVFGNGNTLLGGVKALSAGDLVERNSSGDVTLRIEQYTPLSLLIQAIRQNEDSEVLSTPSILTLNNESAVIDVSDERSVLTGDSTSSDSTADTRRTYERIKFGTRLEVLPQITEGSAVRLELRQIVEDIDPDSESARPNTRSREIETTVVVNDGDILVLGGLSRKNRSLTDNKIPLLSELPLVGDLLFRDRDETALRTNLVLFIRPTILRNAKDSRTLSEERYAALRLRQLMQLRDTRNRGLLNDTEYDILLPKLNDINRGKVRHIDSFMDKRLQKRRVVPKERRKKRRVLRRRPPIDDV